MPLAGVRYYYNDHYDDDDDDDGCVPLYYSLLQFDGPTVVVLVFVLVLVLVSVIRSKRKALRMNHGPWVGWWSWSSHGCAWSGRKTPLCKRRRMISWTTLASNSGCDWMVMQRPGSRSDWQAHCAVLANTSNPQPGGNTDTSSCVVVIMWSRVWSGVWWQQRGVSGMQGCVVRSGMMWSGGESW